MQVLAMVLHLLGEKEDDCLLLWAPKYTITMCDWRVFPKIWWCLKQNQMYHWSRTICSYKTDIEESWVPSCPILIYVGEKTQWVILYQFHPTGWETLLHCPWISKISLPTQKTGTLCIWLLCMRSEKTPWQTLEGETKVTQWTCSSVVIRSQSHEQISRSSSKANSAYSHQNAPKQSPLTRQNEN